jgi:hypothetical protein
MIRRPIPKATERLSNAITGSSAARPFAPRVLRLFHWLDARGLRRAGLPYPLAESYFGDALTLRFDPKKITRRVSMYFGVSRLLATHNFIVGGDWEPDAEPLHAHPKFIEMRSLLDSHPDFRACEAYAQRVQEMEQGMARKHRNTYLDSIERIDAYFQHYVCLIYSLRAHGCRSQHEVGGDDAKIGVAIGQSGEVMQFRKGNHRRALAKLLGLERIVVGVRMIHAAWLRECVLRYGPPPAVALRAGLSELGGTLRGDRL